MPTNTILLSVLCVALLSSSPALCQMSGPGGAAERTRLPSVGDWARPSNSSRHSIALPAEAVSAENFNISDAKKRELEEQISQLKSICPNCAIGVTIGGPTIVGANVAGAGGGSSSVRNTSVINSFSAQEAKCAALPAGASDIDCVLVSKGLYEYLRGRYRAQ